MPPESAVGDPDESPQRDRFYVQEDKHALFQKWGKDRVDEDSPFPLLKDVVLFAAAVGWAHRQRIPIRGRRQVGFWRTFNTQEDVPFIEALGISETGDPTVVADQGALLTILEEYANAGIDILQSYERHDTESTVLALAGLVVELTQASDYV